MPALRPGASQDRSAVVKAAWRKYNASSDTTSRFVRRSFKEERADLVKHHLVVLWTDYFKVEHLKEYPNLHDLFWMATKSAGEDEEERMTSRSPIGC